MSQLCDWPWPRPRTADFHVNRRCSLAGATVSQGRGGGRGAVTQQQKSILSHPGGQKSKVKGQQVGCPLRPLSACRQRSSPCVPTRPCPRLPRSRGHQPHRVRATQGPHFTLTASRRLYLALSPRTVMCCAPGGWGSSTGTRGGGHSSAHSATEGQARHPASGRHVARPQKASAGGRP